MDQDKFDLKTLTRHFEVHNRSEGKSARTVEWYNGALELFQGWLKDLRRPKVTDKVIEPLTSEDLVKIFASMNPNTPLVARNTAIYSLMLDTGPHLSEVVTLKYEDVHVHDR